MLFFHTFDQLIFKFIQHIIMGNNNKKQLTVITINYSGILLSPFEFYSQEFAKQESQLSAIFEGHLKQTFKQYKKQSFKWNLGKIDQKMQKERYTPIYNPLAGVVGDKIISSAEFQKLWNQTFDKNVSGLKDLKYSQDERKRASQFDLLCFKTILTYVYKDVNFQDTSKLNVAEYANFMTKMFEKSFLVESKKIAKTIKALEAQQVDVAFVQQSNQALINELTNKKYNQKYVIFKKQKCQSLIVLNKKKFTKIHQSQQILKNIKFTQENQLNWNDDLVLAFVDNLILISGHLSSKKQKNQSQVKQMKKSLQLLQEVYPACNIIVGCDANSYVSDLPKGFQTFPLLAQQYTTCKKRTFMQPQVNKAQQVALACRDHLISNSKLLNAKVCTIQNKPSHVSKQYILLPCQEHPFDHFVVRAEVSIQKFT